MSVDVSTITRESLPLTKRVNDDVFAGTVALNGSITVEITKPASETVFQKIIQMVQTAQDEKSPKQLFIERFEDSYVKRSEERRVGKECRLQCAQYRLRKREK